MIRCLLYGLETDLIKGFDLFDRINYNNFQYDKLIKLTSKA